MLKNLAIFLVLVPSVAFAADVPTPQEQLAQDKIQFGQLLIQLGQAELKIQQLQKQLEETKAEPNASKH